MNWPTLIGAALGGSIVYLFGYWVGRRNALEDEIAMLRRCLTEHHAAGVLEGVLIGEDCPVCERRLK